MEKYRGTPGRARELQECANPQCGHRRIHHHPRAGVCMTSASTVTETGWCPCDEFEAPVGDVKGLAAVMGSFDTPTAPCCTQFVPDTSGPLLPLKQCGAPLMDRQMEGVKCERGHWMARPDLFEPSEPDDDEPEPEHCRMCGHGPEHHRQNWRRGGACSACFPDGGGQCGGYLPDRREPEPPVLRYKGLKMTGDSIRGWGNGILSNIFPDPDPPSGPRPEEYFDEPEQVDALGTAFAHTEATRRQPLASGSSCPACNGSGVARDCNTCPTCAGSGLARASVDRPTDEQVARAHAVAEGHVSLTAAHRALDQAADRERRNDLARARRASVLHPEVQAAAAERVDVDGQPFTREGLGPMVAEFVDQDGKVVAHTVEGGPLRHVPDGTYVVRYRTARHVTIVNGTRIEQP